MLSIEKYYMPQRLAVVCPTQGLQVLVRQRDGSVALQGCLATGIQPQQHNDATKQ